MKSLGIDPVHETRETYRALLDAMSEPGTVARAPSAPADHAVVATLVDHEVSAHVADGALREALDARGRLDAAAPEEAAVVHTVGTGAWDVRDLRRGTLVEPSEGATVVYRVDALAAGRDGPGTTIRLAGPGVPGERHASVALPPAELDGIADAGSTYPRGVDAVFAAGEQLLAVPRSVTVEVV